MELRLWLTPQVVFFELLEFTFLSAYCFSTFLDV